MTNFQKAMVEVEIERQNKEAQKKAKKAYVKELMAQGVDKTMAEVMAKSFMECGLIKAM